MIKHIVYSYDVSYKHIYYEPGQFLSIHLVLNKEAVTHGLNQRSLISHTQQGHTSSSTHYNKWILPPLIGLIVGVILLTLALLLCVKGSSE